LSRSIFNAFRQSALTWIKGPAAASVFCVRKLDLDQGAQSAKTVVGRCNLPLPPTLWREPMSRETRSSAEKYFIVFFRLTMGWTFLYAAMHHFGDDKFVVGFLSHVKTFHDVYAPMTNPTTLPMLTFLVEYGHLLIGLSLISGLLVRASSPFAIMLMVLYWTAHMDFPYIEDANNYLIDYHIVYVGVLGYLIFKNAGHVWGLDGLLERWHLVDHYPVLRPLVG
jgi:thiosulfate dehydrogenase [quinone] large subunit